MRVAARRRGLFVFSGWSKYTGDKFERGVSPYAEEVWKLRALFLFFFPSLFESPRGPERSGLNTYPRDQKVTVKVLISDVDGENIVVEITAKFLSFRTIWNYMTDITMCVVISIIMLYGLKLQKCSCNCTILLP